jgi:tripartite-type tricarboxylate transporter receptor subunit TctC
MDMVRRELLRGSAAVLALAAAPVVSWAQAYPVRPVRIIVPFPTGGPPDLTARIVAQKLTESLGQPFLVENVIGAGGNTGIVAAAKARPDGYTIIVISTAFFANPTLYGWVPYDPIRDFTPIASLAAVPNVLTAHPALPARTVQELVALIRANPGKYSYAHPDGGSSPHLAGEMFKQRFRLDLVTVPFEGALPAIAATVSGRTAIAWTAVASALLDIKSGKLRGLAVTSAKRIAALPDMPTMTEAGAPDMETETLTGVLAPAGTPKVVIEPLRRALGTILGQREIRHQLVSLGFEPVESTPEEFGLRIAKEIVRWRNIVRDANIVPTPINGLR